MICVSGPLSQPDMERLSDDLAKHVLAFLDIRSFVRASATCRRFVPLRADDRFWKVLDSHHKKTVLLVDRRTQCRNLTLIARWVANTSRLKQLVIRDCFVDDVTSLAAALAVNKTLVLLDLKGNQITVRVSFTQS
jgi:hypothetical protein